MATKVTSAAGGDVVSASKSGRTLESAVTKLVELQEEINIDIDTFVGLKRTAQKIIAGLSNEKHRRVLTERYLIGKTFEAIAEDMDYSYFGICRLHGVALVETEKIIKKMFEV